MRPHLVNNTRAWLPKSYAIFCSCCRKEVIDLNIGLDGILKIGNTAEASFPGQRLTLGGGMNYYTMKNFKKQQYFMRQRGIKPQPLRRTYNTRAHVSYIQLKCICNVHFVFV